MTGELHGWVFNIQRFSIHDGPGIRTTVFVKGCPLRCVWCHNPEGLEARAQVRLTMNLCTRCGRCAAACGRGGHEVTADGHWLHLAACTVCGACVEACPVGALEVVGKVMPVSEVLAVVRRDVPFYETSGGGMTVSGGEPLAQLPFTRALLKAAKAEGMHTAVETSSAVPWVRLAAVAPFTDLFLVDIKHTDNARHRALTGVSNRRILANIRRMAEAGWPLVVRVPWVPTLNAEDAFLQGLTAFLTSLPAPPPVELLLYHRLGLGKWSALGGMSPLEDTIPMPSPEDAAPWVAVLQAAGISAKTGA